MQPQNTIKNAIYLKGIDCFGGNIVETILKPAEEDTGIVFQTQKGDIQAKLEYASPYKASISLNNGQVKLVNVEHMLATLYAYGIDNALVEVKRIPSKSFEFLKKIHLATDFEVLPIFPEREKTLCDKLDEVGIEKQKKDGKMFKLDDSVISYNLSFHPMKQGLIIEATTDYPVPGEQSLELGINPQTYRDELSRSRPYAKHVKTWIPLQMANILASLLNPSFGIGHGFDDSNVFLPVKTRKEWYEKQPYPRGDEITRHTIVDRLGAIALLDGRFEGVRIATKYSGHENDLNFLKTRINSALIYTRG